MKKSHIKQLREDRGLTQLQVAMKAKMSVRGYQNIEAGKCRPNIESAKKIASVLNTTVDELFPACRDAKTAGRGESSQ